MIWLETNNYKPPLYLHTFSTIGRTQCFSGSYYLEYNEPPEGPLIIDDTEQYQGLYLLENGNILEAHEWMDPQWDVLIEPFGSIYYDIYDYSAVTE